MLLSQKYDFVVTVNQLVHKYVSCMVLGPGHIEKNTYIHQKACMLVSERRK